MGFEENAFWRYLADDFNYTTMDSDGLLEKFFH